MGLVDRCFANDNSVKGLIIGAVIGVVAFFGVAALDK